MVVKLVVPDIEHNVYHLSDLLYWQQFIEVINHKLILPRALRSQPLSASNATSTVTIRIGDRDSDIGESRSESAAWVIPRAISAHRTITQEAEELG